MTAPEAEGPWASADHRPGLAPPASDGFCRVTGEHASAENAKAEPGAPDLGRFEPTPYDPGISDGPEVTWAEIRRDDPEAGLGHDYDGPELRSGTPEYEALYAEYQAWAVQPDPEAGRDSADSNAYQARAEVEPEAEP